MVDGGRRGMGTIRHPQSRLNKNVLEKVTTFYFFGRFRVVWVYSFFGYTEPKKFQIISPFLFTLKIFFPFLAVIYIVIYEVPLCILTPLG